MSTKLPKQWRDWCRSMKLRPEGRKRGQSQYQWYSLQGRGHRWRVNCHGVFQIGDPYDEFDRWARCTVFGSELPTTKKQFQDVVRQLLSFRKAPCDTCEGFGEVGGWAGDSWHSEPCTVCNGQGHMKDVNGR